MLLKKKVFFVAINIQLAHCELLIEIFFIYFSRVT